MFRSALVAALLVTVPVAGWAASLPDIVAGKTAATPGLSGLAVAVADRDGMIRAEAFGDAVAGQRALLPETPMRVASISKAVVAIAVVRLVEAGKLDLDSDVSKTLGWSLRSPAWPEVPITLRMLLSHTSGVSDGERYGFPLESALRDSMTATHWSGTRPGANFGYANLNYGIIATVMEAATRERFDRLMTRLVLAPLNIDGGYNWSGASDAAVASAAVLYRKGEDETRWKPEGPWVAQVDDLRGKRAACPVASIGGCDLGAYVPGGNGTLFSPQGGLRISVVDLARIGRMLLRGGEVDGVRLLSAASVETLMTPVWQASGDPRDDDYHGQMLCYGAGLQCLSGKAGASDQPVTGARWWGHLGEAYGLLGGLWVDRDHDRVMAYLITGTADDPTRAAHVASAFNAVEDLVMQELAATPRRRYKGRKSWGDTR